LEPSAVSTPPPHLTEIPRASPTAAHVSSDPNGRCHPFPRVFLKGKNLATNGIGGFSADNKTLTNKLGLRTKTTEVCYFVVQPKKRHTHNTLNFHFSIFGDVFFLGEEFQARKPQQFHKRKFFKENFNKCIPSETKL